MSFDNSYSYLKSKTVRYHIEVPPPSPAAHTHRPARARFGADAGQGSGAGSWRDGQARPERPRRSPDECPPSAPTGWAACPARWVGDTQGVGS